MAHDHERIEELLAGYALQSLGAQDAAEADRLLVDHVPACPMCRETLDDFREIAGDLGLAVPSVTPPDLVLGRIRQAIDEEPIMRRRRASIVAAAAALAAILAMGTWSVFAGQRANEATERATVMQRAIDDAALADATLVSLDEGLTEISVPSRQRIYLLGRDIPPPAPGSVFVLWLSDEGRAERVAEFVPDDDGSVVLEFTVDPARYDRLWITEQAPDADVPTGRERWSSSL